MRRRVVLAVAMLLLAAPGAVAKDRKVHCFLSVDGTTYLDQTCVFSPETDGSFSIGTTGADGIGDAMPFFAYVNKNDDGTARGSWNEDATVTKAQSDLGVLRRKGACWQNSRAKVCAD